jgi:hypothetical protein
MEESGELLNSTNSSGNLLDKENEYPDTRSTKRYRVFCELVETEQNYVNVLETVIDVSLLNLFSSS